MSFLILGGVVVPVKDGTAQRELVFKGERHEVVTGAAADGRRERRRQWTETINHLSQTDAESIELWANGYGHAWNFDAGLHASSGLGPTAGHAAHLDITGGWDGGAVVVRSGGSLSYAVGALNEWTALVKIRHDDGSWHQYAITSDGIQFKDGLAGTWLTASGGHVSLEYAAGSVTLNAITPSGSAADVYFDDLVFLLFRASNWHIGQLAVADESPPPLPYQTIAGDQVEQAKTIIVSSQVTDGTFAPRVISGSFQDAPLDLVAQFHEIQADSDFTALIPRPDGYWPMDGEAVGVGGGRLGDLIALRDAAPTFVPAYVDGPGGITQGAVRNTDQTRLASVPDGATFEASNFTVACWYRKQSAVAGVLMAKGDGSAFTTSQEWALGADATDHLIFAVTDATTGGTKVYTSVDALSAIGTWRYVAVSYSAATGPVLFHGLGPTGATVATSGTFTQIRDTATHLTVHGGDFGGFFAAVGSMRGDIAHAAYWSSALTPSQMRAVRVVTGRGHRLPR